MNRKLGERLPIQCNLLVVQRLDERRIADSMHGERCIETHDPELPEGALLCLAITVGKTASLHDCFIGLHECGVPHAAVALRKLANFLVTPVSDNASLDAHGLEVRDETFQTMVLRCGERECAVQALLALTFLHE